jgi:hypothetical protein
MQDYSNRQMAFQRRRERRPITAQLPMVATGCICPNGGEADERGFVVTCPCCEVHARRRGQRASLPIPRPPSTEERRAAAEVEAARRQKRQREYMRKMKRR